MDKSKPPLPDSIEPEEFLLEEIQELNGILRAQEADAPERSNASTSTARKASFVQALAQPDEHPGSDPQPLGFSGELEFLSAGEMRLTDDQIVRLMKSPALMNLLGHDANIDKAVEQATVSLAGLDWDKLRHSMIRALTSDACILKGWRSAADKGDIWVRVGGVPEAYVVHAPDVGNTGVFNSMEEAVAYAVGRYGAARHAVV